MQVWSFGAWFLIVSLVSLGSLLSNFIGPWYLDSFYYKKRKDQFLLWKLQPQQWISPKLHQEAVYLTIINSIIAGIFFGSYGFYLWSGGWSLLYFGLDSYGIFYSCLSAVLILVYLEIVFFYSHRFWHQHYFRFHKVHHHFSSPTPMTTIAIHPIEFTFNMLLQLLPTFIFPIHMFAYLAVMLHQGSINLQFHSGAKNKTKWFPENQFHDDHHRSVNYNFGQNTTLLDRLHGSFLNEK